MHNKTWTKATTPNLPSNLTFNKMTTICTTDTKLKQYRVIQFNSHLSRDNLHNSNNQASNKVFKALKNT